MRYPTSDLMGKILDGSTNHQKWISNQPNHQDTSTTRCFEQGSLILEFLAADWGMKYAAQNDSFAGYPTVIRGYDLVVILCPKK